MGPARRMAGRGLLAAGTVASLAVATWSGATAAAGPASPGWAAFGAAARGHTSPGHHGGGAAAGSGRLARASLADPAPAGGQRPAFSRPAVATGLSGVSCPTPSLCMAVGGLGSPVTEVWDGRSWHGLPAPLPPHIQHLTVHGVSCASRTRCMAIGETIFGPYALSWNGLRWRIVAAAPLAGPLTGISCPAPARCMAVGFTRPAGQNATAAAEVWDGSTWSVLPMPAVPGAASAALSAVSCASAGSCVAVGSYVPAAPASPGLPLAEQWDGTSWQVLATPSLGSSGGGLSAVSCASASSCIAVGQQSADGGFTFTPLAERWDGQHWTVLTAAVPAGAKTSGLAGVSCAGAASCMAVGSYQLPAGGGFGQDRVLTERWDGTTWLVHGAPGPFPDGNSLASVSCPAADGCMAVGNPGFDSLAEQWNGRTWRARRSGQIDVLAGVSCRSAARCMAAGSYISRSDRGVTLAEAWNGRRWRQHATPTPVPFDSLADVFCTGPAFCMAVGRHFIGGNFAERWNGTRWRAIKAPPGGLDTVSCASATRCMAVGGGAAAAWTGRRWRPVPVPAPHAFSFTLTDLACPAPARCIAVGHKSAIGRLDHAVAEEWNGRRWQILATHQLPPGDLNAVDCAGPSSCMAVGFGLNAQWNGRTWRARPLAGQVGFPGLLDVSCPTTAACMAVGSYSPHRRHPPVGVTEHWNGRTWRLVKPAGRSAALLGVACARPRRCIAVGQVGTLIRAEQWNGSRWRLLTATNP